MEPSTSTNSVVTSQGENHTMVLRDTLLYLAQNERLHQFVISNRATRSVSRRFVAGEVLDDAIQATRVLNQRGMHVSLDHLGENVSEAREARSAARDYISILDTIKQTGVDANISIKLTALGLDITQRMHQQFEHVGTVIQSCLYRSKKDVEQLIAQGVRIRLVKGAYKEPRTIAFQNKSEVDHNYVQLMMMLLLKGNYPALATHDEAIINAACKYARDHGISKEAFEFQMLYGIRRDLQEKLVSQGYNMRIYVPYGSQWYPYLMRRLAERPANLMFVMSNMLR